MHSCSGAETHQINVTDSLSYIAGAHQIKIGLDYRRLSPKSNVQPHAVQYIFESLSNALANKLPLAYVLSRFPDVLVFSSWSVFAQDTWKATRRLPLDGASLYLPKIVTLGASR